MRRTRIRRRCQRPVRVPHPTHQSSRFRICRRVHIVAGARQAALRSARLILDLTPCEDYSSESRRRACVVAKTGVSHTPGVGFVVGGPSPYEFPGYSELDISQQVLIHRCITTQLRRVRRKTHDTDGRYITGARVPATRVLPHEASPLSGEPASPCDGAAPGTRLWPISDDRYISICRRR